MTIQNCQASTEPARILFPPFTFIFFFPDLLVSHIVIFFFVIGFRTSASSSENVYAKLISLAPRMSPHSGHQWFFFRCVRLSHKTQQFQDTEKLTPNNNANSQRQPQLFASKLTIHSPFTRL